MNIAQELVALSQTIVESPGAAADKLEAMATKLLSLARKVRSGQGTREANGIGDRVQINVVGPDGTLKQHAET